MNIQRELKCIIADNLKLYNIEDILCREDDLSKIGVDSIIFIKIIVDIENTFHIEIEDEKLADSNLLSYSYLYQYILEKMK